MIGVNTFLLIIGLSDSELRVFWLHGFKFFSILVFVCFYIYLYIYRPVYIELFIFE